MDDDLLKPTDVPLLIHAIQSRLEHRRQIPPERALKRVSDLMQESLGEITREWLKLAKAHSEIAAIRISDKDRIDHLPKLIEEMAKRVEIDSDHHRGSKVRRGDARETACPPGLEHPIGCD